MAVSYAMLLEAERVCADPKAAFLEDEEPSDDDVMRKGRKRRRSEIREREEREKEQKRAMERREEARKARKKKEEEEEKQRQLEDATRGERTVMVTNVNLKAVEKDVYDFFRAAGPIRDIQLIKDSRSGRSKGVAYVEFFQQEDVANACQLSGQILMLQPVRVQPSQAEKNRASIVARAALMAQVKDPGLKLYVSGLEGALAAISEDDLKKLFSPFGTVEFIDLHKDPYTNKSKGFAYIKFEKASEGREAIAVMNGFKHSMMGDQEIQVGVAQDQGGPLMLTAGGSGTAAQQAQPGAVQAAEVDQDEKRKREREKGVEGLINDAGDRLRFLLKNQKDFGATGDIFSSARSILRVRSEDAAAEKATAPAAEPSPTGSSGSAQMGTIPALLAAGLGVAPQNSAPSAAAPPPAPAYDPMALPTTTTSTTSGADNMIPKPPPPPPPPGNPPSMVHPGTMPATSSTNPMAHPQHPQQLAGQSMMMPPQAQQQQPLPGMNGMGMNPMGPNPMNPMLAGNPMNPMGMAGPMGMPPNGMMMGGPHPMNPMMMGGPMHPMNPMQQMQMQMPPMKGFGGKMGPWGGGNNFGGKMQMGGGPMGPPMGNMMNGPQPMMFGNGANNNKGSAQVVDQQHPTNPNLMPLGSAMSKNIPPGAGNVNNPNAGASLSQTPTDLTMRSCLLFELVEGTEDKETLEDVEDDVGDEVAKYGPVEKIEWRDVAPPAQEEGGGATKKVLVVRFERAEAALNCLNIMHGRLFAGRTLRAELERVVG